MNASQDHNTGKRTYGLFGRLNREWDEICSSPVMTEAYSRWAWCRRELGAYAGPAELVQTMRELQPAEKDTLFAALLSFAIDSEAFGWDLAARVLLQLMLPKAALLARCTWYVRDHEERDAMAVAAMFEVIRTYPLERRPTSIPGNLALDALRLIQRRLAKAIREAHDVEVLVPGVPHGHGADRSVPERSASEEVADLLVWAVDRGVITVEEANELAGGAGYGESQALARQKNVKPEAMRQRRSRAVRRLSEAAREYDESDRFDLPPAA